MPRLPSRSLMVATTVYLLLTAVLFRELLAHVDTHLYSDLGDPLLNTAVLAWNARHLPLTAEWWNFPAFAPLSGVTAFTEHLLIAYPLTSPVIWVTGNPVLAYNLLFLTAFVASAVAGNRLVRELTGSELAAFIGGLALAWAPYQSGRLAHVQTMIAFGMPVALLGLHRYLRTGAMRTLALFAAGWMVTSLSNAYVLAFFPFVVVLWCLWFVPLRDRRRWLSIASAAAIATLPAVPLLLGYAARHSAYGLSRLYGEVRFFSVDLVGIFGISHRATLWRGWLPNTYGEAAIFPGFAIAALGVWAVVNGLRSQAATVGTGRSAADRSHRKVVRPASLALAALLAIAAVCRFVFPDVSRIGPLILPTIDAHRLLSFAVLLAIVLAATSRSAVAAFRRRDAATFYLCAVIVLWLFALGPEPHLGDTRVLTYGPYRLLMETPLGRGVRVPARLWLPGVVCLSAAAGLGAAALLERFPRRRRELAAILAVLIVVEGWFSGDIAEVPSTAVPSASAGALVLDWPMGDPVSDATAEYRAITGGYRVLNGYSGYEPSHYPSLVTALRRRQPSVLDELRQLSELTVVIRGGAEFTRWIAAQPAAERVSASPAITIYHLPLRGAGRVMPLPLPDPHSPPFHIGSAP